MKKGKTTANTDKELITRITNGDKEAFADLIGQTQALVAQLVCRMISIVPDRKDVTQDIYLKVYGNLGSFRFQAKFSTWVGQIAYNTCINYLTKRKLFFPTDFSAIEADDESMADAPNEPLPEPLDIALQRALDELPALQRTLISLFHLEEMSYKEIGTITGLPEGTVKSYLFRARKGLREAFIKRHDKNDYL